MRLSLVIAAHNEGNSLCKTVRSCVETCAGLDYEIVVADDASWDGCVDEAAKHFPQIRVVRHAERFGPSPTKDLGARNARGDVLVFLDGHVKPEPGAIRQLVEDVEQHRGEAVITPAITGLDVARWKPVSQQIGHGYFLELERLDCGWLPLGDLKQAVHRGRTFYESPAAIGCAFAVHRELYDDLRGFDPHMQSWGVEDLDFSLKCWLLGHPILHDPEAVVAHRFRKGFDNFDVPIQDLIANQLRMAYKNFTPGVWREWVERCRRRHPGRLPEHPEGLWTCAWQQFEHRLPSAEQERAYLMFRRVRDEFWYAERFNLLWPRLQAERFVPSPREFESLALQASASPSPSPTPTVCGGGNLVKNPGCEIAPTGGNLTPPHWVQVSGDWQRKGGGALGFPPAHSSGTYLFWAGNTTSAEHELFQDVDVSSESTDIDAGKVKFYFTGWMNIFSGDADTSRIVVEYRNAAGTVLSSYDTGAQNVDVWTRYSDQRTAPVNTRKIRIRLLAKKVSGTSNDGYFDDISLTGSCSGHCDGGNLIKNPGCEIGGTPPANWTQVSGDWRRQQGGIGGFPPAHSGTYLFWAGNTTFAEHELYQDVDVSADSVRIDTIGVKSSFSGWMNTWDTDADTSRIVVEYRSGTGAVLASFDTGAKNDDSWTQYSDVRMLPANTRTIRVRLLAKKVSGTANDGYFDDLSITLDCASCVESGKTKHYSGIRTVFGGGAFNLVGSDGLIEGYVPEIDCEASGTWFDQSVAWIGVTQTSNANGSGDVTRWAQSGYVKERVKEGTEWVVKFRRYAESEANHQGSDPATYFIEYGNPPGPSFDQYTCDMPTPTNGQWKFYFNGSPWAQFTHDTWKTQRCNRFDATSETNHVWTRIVGSKSNHCTFKDLRYRQSGGSFTSPNLVAADKSVTDSSLHGCTLGTGMPVDNFEIWDKRVD